MILPFDALGEGEALVLLHAGLADRTMWREHLVPLAEAGRRVVAVDLPGFGEAGLQSGPQAPWDDVLETIALLIGGPAALVGNSFGGAVALRVAAIAPERVSALVLVSAPAPGIEPSPQLQATAQAEESALARGDVEGAIEAILAAWMLPDAPPALRERVAAMQRRAFLLQSASPEASEGPDPLENRLEALARIRAPALCAAGRRDMPDFLAAAQELARSLPDARHAVIARAGHLAPLETPRAFRRLVLSFLADVESGRPG
ncbi:MAG TPA: alpha/beta hydrolase [Solirubrobacteraceae bacterium]|nr:alpha/beta hydrolase [Solirubrobacteraceae bacterium]